MKTAQLYGLAAKQARIAVRPLCKIEDCYKPVRSLGLCGLHYERLRRHGDPCHIERNYRERGPTQAVARVKTILAILESYNASPLEAAWIFNVHSKTAVSWARKYGFAFRRDRRGQEWFFSESPTHRRFVCRGDDA